uniref:Uncharacterized protein n=1 Tax=Timema genevievae TaxID=629358 RepID=A0A7R9PPI8_TIMGE|nr:unnamed protein product [Timema genevievae]
MRIHPDSPYLHKKLAMFKLRPYRTEAHRTEFSNKCLHEQNVTYNSNECVHHCTPAIENSVVEGMEEQCSNLQFPPKSWGPVRQHCLHNPNKNMGFTETPLPCLSLCLACAASDVWRAYGWPYVRARTEASAAMPGSDYILRGPPEILLTETSLGEHFRDKLQENSDKTVLVSVTAWLPTLLQGQNQPRVWGEGGGALVLKCLAILPKVDLANIPLSL